MRIDELELSWEDETDRGRHRRRRRGAGGGSRRGRGGRSVVALLLTIAILGLVAGGVWYGSDKVRDFIAVPDYNSGGTGEVVFEVKKGQNATDVGRELEKQDIVKSQKAFVQAANKNKTRSKAIQPGFYKLRKQMRASDALSMLTDTRNRVVSGVTIKEGLTWQATLAELARGTKLPLEDLKTAIRDPLALGIPDWWFNRSDTKQATKSVEGFLFPATYEFSPGVTAQQVVTKMITEFLKRVESIGFVKNAEAKSLTPFSALIVASLVQAEAGTAADMPKVARVIYNRLAKPMNLEFDSTTNYWRELNGQERKFNLTTAELTDPSNPYRTYGQAGLPPGPICNPSEAALEAALNPTPGEDWLFFVRIDKQGNSKFATTLAEHEANIAEAKRNGAY